MATAPGTTPAPTTKGGTTAGDDLSGLARTVLILGGLALAAVGLLLWFFPVEHSKPAPDSAKCTDAKTCWVKVDDAPELLLSSLVVLGGLLFLIGVNGRKISSFKGPAGVGFETSAPKAAEEAKDKAEAKAADAGLSEQAASAAKLVAGKDAEARTHYLEKLTGAPLGASLIEQVSEDAATTGVQTVIADPEIN